MNSYSLSRQLLLIIIMFYSACLLGAEDINRGNIHPYTKASIYLISWEIMSRSNLTPEYIRKNYTTKIEISDPSQINKLLEIIKPKELKLSAVEYEVDVRLVIDLANNAGTKTSYIASRNFLFTEDLKYSRRIDVVFRDKFRF